MNRDDIVGSEAALCWIKSSYSDNAGGECVEVATATSSVHVRDSKAPAGPQLTVSRGSWTDFLQYATTV
ncbi:DUF397 domain-containing protein [Streptomyces albidus (ex Kaewkla and Franco 2022)]|uniref:DUF397 domain-containing protein n=1 Tax=Streptomyces albidus (ex Kaewkla and Franco 2022) TaxID=722709 RepID=UPI0015EE974A|nr:DUF397 domain-containing protein [Streptomyces albidus (ex Kaewkla and Franco 2022)]